LGLISAEYPYFVLKNAGNIYE